MWQKNNIVAIGFLFSQRECLSVVKEEDYAFSIALNCTYLVNNG